MSKLVENLAEELVEKLKEDGTLNLSDNEKFEEFTDLLYEILDNGVETEQRIIDTNDKMETVDKKADDLNRDVNSLAASIYNYFRRNDAEKQTPETGNDGSWLRLKMIETNQNKILSIVEKLQTNATVQTNEIETVKKEVQKSKSDDNIQTTTGDTTPTDSTDDEKGSKHHVRTIQYLKSIKGAVAKSERNLRRDNKRMERSIKSKIKSGFGKWWGRLKKVLFIAAIFLFGGVIKRILGGIAEMTEPLWRPFTDWFQKNFPKLSEGIQWVMHAVGQILDFALTLKGLYDKYNDMDDDKKGMIKAGATVASYTATGAAVGGVPGAAAGAAVGIFAAQLGEAKDFNEITEKYEEARKQYEAELENKNLTAIERTRLEMELAQLDYLYDEQKTKHVRNQGTYNTLWSSGAGLSGMIIGSIGSGARYLWNRKDANESEEKYNEAKQKYEDMQQHPEWFDDNGNYDYGKMNLGGIPTPTSTWGEFMNNTDGGANITSNNSFTTIEVTVRPEDSPLKPK